MRRIEGTIPDTISGEERKKYKRGNIADPAEICFAMGEDSWARDGRENLPLSVGLVKSLLRAYTTDNSYTDTNHQRCKGDKVLETDKKPILKKGDVGNPIVWGTLDSVIVAVMGSDKEPLLVVGASGRQKVKHAEYLTDMLRHCRSMYEEELKTNKGADEAVRQRAVIKIRLEADAWENAWLDTQDPTFAAACRESEMRIMGALSDEDWDLIFSDKCARPPLGRPLVGKGYSAVYFVKVDHDETKPTSRAALEKAKLAHTRIPSPILAEADSARRMIEDDVVNRGKIESKAIECTQTFVTNPIAVGPSSGGATYEWVEQLYRVSQCSEGVRALISAERDPIKALELVKKLAKKCFKPLRDEDTGLTRNALSDEEQMAVLAPKNRVVNKRKSAPAPTTSSTAVAVPNAEAARFSSLARSPMSTLSAEQRLIAKAVAAGLQYAAGAQDALDEFPFLKIAPVVDEVLEEAIDAVDAWNGKGRPKLRDAKEDDEQDAQTIAAAQKLIDEGMGLCDNKKDKQVWLAEWLRDKKG